MKHWIFQPDIPENQLLQLSKNLNIDPILAKILIQRGLTDFDSSKSFFRPQISQLYDPFLMKDMKKAVDLLNYHIQKRNKILVYGDYDVDGTTSVAMLFHFLKQFDQDVDYYIPDRYAEGYGISRAGIEHANQNNYQLIVALDCGIRAVDNIDLARQYGIDVIICDHHLPGESVPDANAILNPKQKGCDYPFKELSGCGIGFKLIQGFSIEMGIEFSQIQPYLDLVSVSIAADIVPLIDENRVLMYYGLLQLNQSPRPGLKALLDISGRKQEVSVTDIVFGVAPRINAAGRIAHGNHAVQLLCTDNEDEASEISSQVNEFNNERRSLDEAITNEALELMENEKIYSQRKSTVLFKEHWHKGVVGIVASRVIERHYKPTIILGESSGEATGSARSVSNYNIYQAIHNCRDILTKYGGHHHAAGLSLPVSKVDQFIEKFENEVAKTITSEQLIPSVLIDSKLELEKINGRFFSIIDQMNPFGPENMNPVFASENVYCTNARTVGKDHLKLNIRQGDGRSHEAIGFGMAHHLSDLCSTTPFSLAYTLNKNEYNGISSIQLVIKDIKINNN